MRLQHQLAPFVELSDALREDLGQRWLEESAVWVAFDDFEGLKHGLGG